MRYCLKLSRIYAWLWVATIEPGNKQTNSRIINIKGEKYMFVAERFISKLVITFGSHPLVSTTDGGT